MATKKGSIETLAKFFISEYHKEYDFDFDKHVTLIEFSNCFTLRIFNAQNEISTLYLVCPIDRLVAETSQPFYDKLMRYFEEIQTNPLNNYWIGYVEVDENFIPLKCQRFQIPKKFP